MYKHNLIITFLILLNAQLVKAQPDFPQSFDTIPKIVHIKQNLHLIDKIRCVSYLFARNFAVVDSLGNIYVSLHYTKDNHETTAESTEITAISLFNVAYFYAFYPIMDHIKYVYKSFVITIFDKNHKVIYYKDYPIRTYNKKKPKEYLSLILKCIRVPNTWRIKDKQYEIIYYCMDKSERMEFIRPLVLTLYKLNLLDKKCTTWKEFYPGCHDREFTESAYINLPK